MFHGPDLSRRRHAQPFDLPELIGSATAALMLICGGALATGWASVLGAWLIAQ
jgi:hypothetical protein